MEFDDQKIIFWEWVVEGEIASPNSPPIFWVKLMISVIAFRRKMTRHSFASQLGAAGVSVNVIKDLLGHTEISTSMKYTHPDLESKRTSIEKLSLKGEGQVLQFSQGKEMKGQK
jgi:integrase